jgi:hypothetical protein
MLPLQLPGIALAGRLLLTKYYGNGGMERNNLNFRLFPQRNNSTTKFAVKNPLEILVRGLTSTISQIKKSTTGVDYKKIIKNHIPDDAVLLRPRHPRKSNAIYFTDIDGDSREEMIASYKDTNGIITIILKNRNGNWEKEAEIKNSGYNTLDYRGALSNTGKGKRHLLLGLASKNSGSGLYGYSIEKDNINQIFSRGYNRFEVLKQNANRDGKSQVAIWNRKDIDAYDVELFNLNGTQIEPVNNPANYYYKRVVPYHVGKIKQNPYNCTNWFNIAEALGKAGARRDALTAIDVGIELDKESKFLGRFNELRDEILRSSIYNK